MCLLEFCIPCLRFPGDPADGCVPALKVDDLVPMDPLDLPEDNFSSSITQFLHAAEGGDERRTESTVLARSELADLRQPFRPV